MLSLYSSMIFIILILFNRIFNLLGDSRIQEVYFVYIRTIIRLGFYVHFLFSKLYWL